LIVLGVICAWYIYLFVHRHFHPDEPMLYKTPESRVLPTGVLMILLFYLLAINCSYWPFEYLPQQDSWRWLPW
jgi:hypothetical protein